MFLMLRPLSRSSVVARQDARDWCAYCRQLQKRLSYTSLLCLPFIVGQFIVQSKHYNDSNVAIYASLSYAWYAFKSQSNIHRFQLTVSCLLCLYYATACKPTQTRLYS